jgi:hypothetical protein
MLKIIHERNLTFLSALTIFPKWSTMPKADAKCYLIFQ